MRFSLSDKKKLFDALAGLVTESRNTNTYNIDEMDSYGIAKSINAEDKLVAVAVEKELIYVARAIDLVAHQIKNGGRLLYFGAGTSGRLGVLDAVECPPTFGVSPELVVGRIAGGYDALVRAIEGAEDKEQYGAEDVAMLNVNDLDVVCGIAASRRTPYVVGAIEEARRRGAKTIAIVCNPREELEYNVDVAICPVPGPEVIMGSTRMKAGTAQKLILNMLTTGVMIKLGKVYENMMIDLQLNNQKLIERSKKIIMLASGVDYPSAEKVLAASGGNVKVAIFMAMTDLDSTTSANYLLLSNGFLKHALSLWREQK